MVQFQQIHNGRLLLLEESTADTIVVVYGSSYMSWPSFDKQRYIPNA